MRRIAIVTSTRADWGLLHPVADALRKNDNVELHIIATNMHLDRARGMTLTEIEADGFSPIHRVEMPIVDDSPESAARAAGRCAGDMAAELAGIHPDILLILGDRFEMLAVALAAILLAIPIAHISGGEITEGAFDDNIRHAISKLSALHFATTDSHRRRLIAMGEQPHTVYNTGALGVHNIHNVQLMSPQELNDSLGFELTPDTFLVTFHPATNDSVDPTARFSELLKALEEFPNPILFTAPNNDPRSARLLEMIEAFRSKHPERVRFIPSLGRKRYLSALNVVEAVIGNSSSGIVEVPSAGIPTVDIGVRQRGRTAAPSVIHCGDTAGEIVSAITTALSPEFRVIARQKQNPYFKADTVDSIVDILCSVDIKSLLPKMFHDIIPLP